MASVDGPPLAPSAGPATGGALPRTGNDAGAAGATYTAVVYVHGMGSQRRFEELSRLIDMMDQHARIAGGAAGALTVMTPRIEPPRGALEGDVTYVEVMRRPPPSGHEAGSSDDAAEQGTRFYEVYWAPAAAGRTSLRAVVAWLARQALNPIRTARSAWRYRSRLRRAALHELVSTSGAAPAGGTATADLETLVRLYDDFDAPEARRRYPRGRFREFLDSIEDATSGGEAQRLQSLARRWRVRYARSELVAFITVVTILLALVLGAGFVAAAIYALLLWLRAAAPGIQAPAIEPRMVIALTAGALGALGLTRFLVDYMGDVQLWTTYEETSAKRETRSAILRASTRLLAHVLLDPSCTRVAVVAHSLGTTIALDSLLELARYNRGRSPERPMDSPLELRKIEHFVTLGSPIDKVHYFFEHYQGRLYRYNQIVEAVRGDIGTPPFSDPAEPDGHPRPHIHWINFWDRGDIIGGPVESPSHARHAALRVDNVEVDGLVFPDPGASHSAYFTSATVVRTIFEAIFDRAYSFVHPALDVERPASYTGRFVGPGSGRTLVRWLQAMMLVIPWLVIVGLATTSPQGDSFWGYLERARHSPWVMAAGVILAGMVIGAIAARVKGNRDALREERKVDPDDSGGRDASDPDHRELPAGRRGPRAASVPSGAE